MLVKTKAADPSDLDFFQIELAISIFHSNNALLGAKCDAFFLSFCVIVSACVCWLGGGGDGWRE